MLDTQTCLSEFATTTGKIDKVATDIQKRLVALLNGNLSDSSTATIITRTTNPPVSGKYSMADTISRGLDLLAAGLRPYIADRVKSRSDNRVLADIERGDAQFLLVFMWDRWNDLFREDLSFVERSLISELRDFRNRWAHQDHLSEQDTYRVLDDIERLLHAVKSDQTWRASELRRESLNRLWQAEVGRDGRNRAFRIVSPYLLCLSSAAAISVAFFQFFKTPWNAILSILVFVGMVRLAWHQSQRESVSLSGPKECGRCGKII